MMDIKNPEYFITLADRRNMSRAAQALGLSQPSLSYYLTRLEQDVGCALFLRRKNELELTPAGQLYLEAARQTAALRDRVYRDIHHLSRENRLWVLAGEDWTEALLNRVLPRFQERFPATVLEIELDPIRAEELLSAPSLPGERPDFCLGSAPYEAGRVLARMPLYLALPQGHPYPETHPHVTAIGAEGLGELFSQESLLAHRPGSCLDRLTERVLGENRPRNTCSAHSLRLQKTLFEAGRGAAILPKQDWPALWLKLQPETVLYRVLWQREDSPDRQYFAQLCEEMMEGQGE